MSKKSDLVFAERLAAAEDELKWLYMELYDDEEAYDYFVTMLKDNYDRRKPALKKLDEQRLSEPDWYKRRDLLGMLMYVQAFGREGREWNGTLNWQPADSGRSFLGDTVSQVASTTIMMRNPLLAMTM
ncbi:MAG: hypothetical protein J6T17_04175, partial [Clostridia bacterium]|nr:hypothetical protein [Clostridia bacterium]